MIGWEDSGEIGMYVAEQEVEVGGKMGAQLEREDEMVGGTKFGEEVEIDADVADG